MQIVFFGTPDYTLPILESLHKKFKTNYKSAVIAVVTQKPKPAGRKQILSYSPVDRWAYRKKIQTFYRSDELLERNLKPDIGILASFGEIIPKEVINVFKYGILNIHPSLLPKYRGASPVQAAIICQDKKTGVSIIKLDQLLDHGEIICQFDEDLLPEDTTETLRKRLFFKSAEVLTTLLPSYLRGKITPRKQDEDKVIFTSQIKKDDAFIPPEFLFFKNKQKKWIIPFIKNLILKPTAQNMNSFIRAMQPWPIAWTIIKINGKELRLKIHSAHLERTAKNKERLVLDKVQVEGKNPVSWQQLSQAYPKIINK